MYLGAARNAHLPLGKNVFVFMQFAGRTQVFHINFWLNIYHINFSSKMDIFVLNANKMWKYDEIVYIP